MCYFKMSEQKKNNFFPVNTIYFMCKQHIEYCENVVILYVKLK